MNDWGFGNVPSGRALADRLSRPLLESGNLDVLILDGPVSDPDAAPGPAPSALLHHVFGGIEWAIMGQVSLVGLPRLVQSFEADLDPFIERIKKIDRPYVALGLKAAA